MGIGMAMRALGSIFFMVVLLLVIPMSANAAYFTITPPATSESGAGPFRWSFASDGGPEMDGTAYRLSTDGEWHDCTITHNLELVNLPDGPYSLEIANDLNKNGAGNQLYSGRYAHCFETPAPAPTTPISVSSFVVGAHPSAPSQPGPGPGSSSSHGGTAPITPPSTNGDACAKAQQAEKKARVIVNVAERRYQQSRRPQEAHQWRRALRAGKKLYRREKHNVEVLCA